MTTLETLKSARKLLSGRGAWAKNWFAFDKTGKSVASQDPAACSWCALGAINAVTSHGLVRRSAVKAFELEITGGNICVFNDKESTKKPSVLAAFDAAIAKLEKAA